MSESPESPLAKFARLSKEANVALSEASRAATTGGPARYEIIPTDGGASVRIYGRVGDVTLSAEAAKQVVRDLSRILGLNE